MKTWTLSKFLPFGKNRDHSLLLEIFEISRNARMIMDENNNLILSNSKFDTLCTPFGQPSYESLILFFGGTDEIRKRFSHLSSEARKGEINKVEMGHDFEGQGSW
ncbi:MAG TPA: hypothetical protein PKH37_03255, partial [Alphaproteobacteria bacterium]|nr:hypothetical protein [Alphaproteobacteria bacterium]